MTAWGQQVPCMFDGESKNAKVDLSDTLDSGEALDGNTLTVTELSTSDLTISNVTRNSSEMTLFEGTADETTVSANQGCKFQVSGQQADTEYTLEIKYTTDSSPSQTLIAKVTFQAED